MSLERCLSHPRPFLGLCPRKRHSTFLLQLLPSPGASNEFYLPWVTLCWHWFHLCQHRSLCPDLRFLICKLKGIQPAPGPGVASAFIEQAVFSDQLLHLSVPLCCAAVLLRIVLWLCIFKAPLRTRHKAVVIIIIVVVGPSFWVRKVESSHVPTNMFQPP